MQLIQTLERSGYDVVLTDRDGLQIVEARRRPDAVISTQGAAPLLLALMRCQDEAIEFLTKRNLVQTVAARQALWERIMADPLDPNDNSIAAAICEYNILLGRECTSAGERWVDVMKEYQR